jgi:hypothetical protein
MATVEQVQLELDRWKNDQGDYYVTPDAVFNELWSYRPEAPLKSFEIPSGTVTLMENQGGGEGDGEERFFVINVGDQLFQYTGYYSSWEGTEWNDNLIEVEPYEVTVTKYRVKKD